jgi:hypothetical protein
MKSVILSIVVVFTILSLTSCEKVIHIDLNSDDPKYVIEGTILEGDTTHHIQITRSLNFDQSVAFPTIDNAVVSVTDDLGNVGVFTAVGNGMYELVNYPGVVGRNYTLTVLIDGQAFTASSKMPTAVVIDSLYSENFLFGVDTLRTLVPSHYDPSGESNYYQFHVFINGEKQSGVVLMDDQFTDGNLDVQPLFYSDLMVGDTVIVDMFAIDKPVWSYFNQLSANTAGSGATPANPTSNFSGGCLGYFSARTFSRKSLVVAE